MTDDVDWSRLGRYLAGECTAGEAAEVRRWIEADPARGRLVNDMRAAWNVAGVPTTSWDTSAAWRRLAARLRSRERRAGLVLVRGGLPADEPRRHRWTRPLSAVAAALVLATVGGLWWNRAPAGTEAATAALVPPREVRAPMGQRAQFQLLDGTRVLLGPGSTLRYDTTTFGRSTRDLQLDGQAHFTVAHDPRRPFLVRTARTVTEDLGTEFAITDYIGDSAGVVVVASGTVVVRSVLGDTSRPATLLRGGDLVRLGAEGRTTVRRGVDVMTSLAWTEGRLVFDDTPVGEVVTQLNRWYGGEVRLADPSLAALRFTAAYGAAAESTVVRELATAIGARVRRRDGSTLIVPLSDPQREN